MYGYEPRVIKGYFQRAYEVMHIFMGYSTYPMTYSLNVPNTFQKEFLVPYIYVKICFIIFTTLGFISPYTFLNMVLNITRE